MSVNTRYSSEREDWVQALVLAGHGCSVMPEFLPTLPGIATRRVSEPAVSRTISMVTVTGRTQSPLLRSIMRIARASFVHIESLERPTEGRFSEFPWQGGGI